VKYQAVRVLARAVYRLACHSQINHVLIFENNGRSVVVSNPHPHCQIYATNFVFPNTIETEARSQRTFGGEWSRSVSRSSWTAERADGRALFSRMNRPWHFCLTFARYAYECYVAPKRHTRASPTLDETELRDFAEALKQLDGAL
jgi:UDPglucose--hexose-1-phosphate uridylyltransferase